MNTIKVCSSAMVLIGENPITSFQDTDTPSLIAHQLFDVTYESLLTETRWRFATRIRRLNQIPQDQRQNSDYSAAFLVPYDVLTIQSCSSNPYEIFGNELHTNSTEAKIEYTFKPDLATVPAYFIKALEYRLAQEFSIPITGSSSKVELFSKLAQEQTLKARHIDSTSRTQDVLGQGAYIKVRD